MRAVISGLVAVCTAVVMALLVGIAARGLAPGSAWFALSFGCIAGVAAWISMSATVREDRAACPRGWIQWSVLTVFVLFALRAFCWLIFFDDQNIAFLSPNNLGDLSLHITYTQYLANGAPLWPENPIFAGASLHYPFGVDLFNSLLTLVGVDIVRGLIWAGLLGAAATGVMLWRWGGAFAMAGFLFNGGVAGFAIFTTRHLEDFQDHYAWKSIPLALFVTQRGLLYAIPAGLALLWSWRARFFNPKPTRRLPFWVEALLYATMPLFHLHTFLFLSAMLGYWGISDFASWVLVRIRGPKFDAAVGHPPPVYQVSFERLAGIARLVAVSVLPATVLIWFLTGGFHGASMIYWKPGWLQENENPFRFWLTNFGALPVAVIALFGWLWNQRNQAGSAAQTREYAAFALPAAGVFLIACFVMFAPWEWDNTKLMIWSYLAVLPALWGMLRAAPLGLRALACFALFFSGFVSLIGGIDSTHQGFPLAARKELDALSVPLRGIAITSTFACYPTFNHPLLLSGRKVVAGYDGHLFSHGIDYRWRKAELERLMRGEPGWENRVRQLGVDFLFWGDRERSEFTTSTIPWAASAPVVAHGSWGAIYDLRAVGKP
jgi:hypothetical protein